MENEKDLNQLRNVLIDVLLNIKKGISSKFKKDNLNINLGDHYKLNNTPLYLILELSVVGRELEDDYGICLSVNFQSYDPTADDHVVYSDRLFISADLSKADGYLISSFNVVELNTSNETFYSELVEVQKKLINYLENQVQPIVKTLKEDYALSTV